MSEHSEISREELTSQLDLLCQAYPFDASPRLRRFLHYVVWKSFDENPRLIRAYDIAVDAFGKDASFDPNDPYIRNIARLTRQGINAYYKQSSRRRLEIPASPDRILIEIPNGNYIAKFSRLAVDVAVGASAYQNVEKPNQPRVEESYTKPHLSEQRQLADSPSSKRDVPLLAIIPFSSFNTNENSHESVGEILASELISGISPIPQLDVISRLTTTQFKADGMDKALLAEFLGADYLLTGSYQVTGDMLLLSLELSDSKNSRQNLVWSHFSRVELISLYKSGNNELSELASLIVKETIRHEIEVLSQEPIDSLSMHTALLTGSSLMHCAPKRLFNKAYELFEAVQSQYPNHPTLNTLMAQWYIYRIHRQGGWRVGEDEKFQKMAWKHCEAALEKNPCHAQALTTYGLLYTQFVKDPHKGMEFYKTAERFNPNEPITQAYKAGAHSYFGQGDDAVNAAKRAVRLSPYDPQLHMFESACAAAYFCSNNLEAAEVHAKRAHELNSSHTSNLRTLIAVLIEQDKLGEAALYTKMLLTQDPEFTTSSYRDRSPNSDYDVGKRILESLKLAGVPD